MPGRSSHAWASLGAVLREAATSRWRGTGALISRTAHHVGVERRHRLTLDGARWTVVVELHAVPPGALRPGARSPRFSASLTLWPEAGAPRASRAGEERVRRLVRRAGLSGRWERLAPGEPGRFGDFRIARIRREDLRATRRRLEALVPALAGLGPAARR